MEKRGGEGGGGERGSPIAVGREREKVDEEEERENKKQRMEGKWTRSRKGFGKNKFTLDYCSHCWPRSLRQVFLLR